MRPRFPAELAFSIASITALVNRPTAKMVVPTIEQDAVNVAESGHSVAVLSGSPLSATAAARTVRCERDRGDRADANRAAVDTRGPVERDATGRTQGGTVLAAIRREPREPAAAHIPRVSWQDRQSAFPEPSFRWSHGSRSSGKICRVGTNRAASSIEPMCR